MYISKESFFRIQHKLTKTWIGFEEGGLENERVHRISKHHNISKAPILMEIGKIFLKLAESSLVKTI